MHNLTNEMPYFKGENATSSKNYATVELEPMYRYTLQLIKNKPNFSSDSMIYLYVNTFSSADRREFRRIIIHMADCVCSARWIRKLWMSDWALKMWPPLIFQRRQLLFPDPEIFVLLYFVSNCSEPSEKSSDR